MKKKLAAMDLNQLFLGNVYFETVFSKPIFDFSLRVDVYVLKNLD